MAKYENSKDKELQKAVAEEVKKFSALIKGHEKLLYAIGKL